MPEPTINHNPGTFEFIEQTIRQSALHTELGTDFELLCRFFLLNAPQHKGVFKSVWLWKDWPGRWGADKGIDLVAETMAGQLWAIQAKAVHQERSIPKSELDSFLSESNRPQFDFRLIMATTDDIGRVFATYQSSDRVAAAQKASASSFDLVLADEAHRCTGPAQGLFTTVLDAAKIKARRRLFMTATPRYFTGRVKKRAAELEYELASMDDESRFGPVFHRLPFNVAIWDELLTDYQVVVIGVTQAETRQWAEEGRLVRIKDGTVTDARALASQIGLAKVMRQFDLRKTITFHSSVAKASRFTDAALADSLVGVIERMSPAAKPSGELWTGHISGQTPAGRRSTLLTVFGNLPQGNRAILSNCACLGEGVDVPVLDGVAFIDPKRSMIDIIQAVGRVIRKADDKKIGTVVIPVFVDETEDADHALANSAIEPVWQVLKALRAHDQELANELDELRLKLGARSPGGGKIRLPDKIKVDVPTLVLEDFEQAFYVRTVEETTRKPALTEEMILQWADAKPGELFTPAKHIRLYAIQSAWNKDERYVKCVPISFWLTMVSSCCPDLRQFIASQFPGLMR